MLLGVLVGVIVELQVGFADALVVTDALVVADALFVTDALLVTETRGLAEADAEGAGLAEADADDETLLV